MRAPALAVTLALALPLPLVPAAAGADALYDPLGEAVAEKELGPRLGLQVGQGLSPGGLRVGGVYLHRMTEATFFDAEVGFTFGGGEPICHEDRNSELACEPSLTDGASGSFGLGGRWFPALRPSGFLPFFRAGIGLEVADFRGDDVRGWALPAWLAAGGRFRVADTVAVTGELRLTAGPALYDADLGLQGYGYLLVQFGVDLAL